MCHLRSYGIMMTYTEPNSAGHVWIGTILFSATQLFAGQRICYTLEALLHKSLRRYERQSDALWRRAAFLHGSEVFLRTATTLSGFETPISTQFRLPWKTSLSGWINRVSNICQS